MTAGSVRDGARLLVLLVRPGLLSLLALFTVLGAAQAGAADRPGALVVPLVTVVGFMVAAVALNDVGDEAVDRVNLPDDASRPLVGGSATRRGMLTAAGVGAGTALLGALVLGPLAVAVVLAGLGFAVAYCVRPVRLSDRGLVASLLLPLGYVAVPFALGCLGARGTPAPRDAALLGGLWLGFVGRILLKDFRDVVGDRLLGKRTFLVRHGRAATCRLSAALWCTASAALLAVPGLTVVTVVAWCGQLVAALAAVGALARSRNPHRDDVLIATAALLGRGMVLTLVTHVALRQVHPRIPGVALQVLVTASVLVCAAVLVRTAPASVPRPDARPDALPDARPDAGEPAPGHRGATSPSR